MRTNFRPKDFRTVKATKQKKNRSFFLVAAIVLLTAATANADRVDELVRSRLKERNIPGAAIAVVKNGKVVKLKGYGFASLEFGVPVTADTVFEIGSISKQMTAAAIMLLAEDGKVKLDEKISSYLPGTPEAWSGVTVRNLLTHSSGIRSYTGLDGFELSRRLTMERFIKQLAEQPLEFMPGERNIYSNSGYNLLAYIIQTQSGKPYMDLMRERIFQPLGMTRTGDRDPQLIIPKRAAGYEWRNDRYAGRDGVLTDLMGAGSITSTITDMIKWEAALRGDKFLTAESKRAMWTEFTFNNGERSVYGFGWRITDVRGHKLIGHTGQTAGFGAAIFRYADSDLTVIALTNLGEIGMGSLLASGIAKIFLPSLSIKKMPRVTGADPVRHEWIVNAIRDRVMNRMNEQTMTAELFRSLSSERVRAANARIASFGDVKRWEIVGQESRNSTTVYRYRLEAGPRCFLWRVDIDREGKIAAMILEEEE